MAIQTSAFAVLENRLAIGNKVFNRSTKVTDRADAEKQLAIYNLMAGAKRENRLTEDFLIRFQVESVTVSRSTMALRSI